MDARHRLLRPAALAAFSYLLGALTLGPALAVSTTVHLAPGDQVTVIADLPTPTPTPTPTPVPTPTPTPSPTATPVPTPTPTPFPTPTPTPVPTPTPTPTGCTTTLAAGANIYSALSSASAGAVICLHGGAYSYSGINTVTKQGTAAQPITVQAYPGETPVISDSGAPTTEAIFMYFSGAAYLNVKGLTVNGMPGVQSDGNGSAIFDFVSGSHHITLDGNTLNGSSAWNSSQHAVYIAYDSHDLTVTNNVIDGNGALGAGVHMYHQPPTGTNITVQGNTIREWDQCILDWLDDNNVLIKANTFSTCRIAMRYGANGTTTLDSNIIGTGVTTRLYVDSGSTGLTQVGQSW